MCIALYHKHLVNCCESKKTIELVVMVLVEGKSGLLFNSQTLRLIVEEMTNDQSYCVAEANLSCWKIL